MLTSKDNTPSAQQSSSAPPAKTTDPSDPVEPEKPAVVQATAVDREREKVLTTPAKNDLEQLRQALTEKHLLLERMERERERSHLERMELYKLLNSMRSDNASLASRIEGRGGNDAALAAMNAERERYEKQDKEKAKMIEEVRKDISSIEAKIQKLTEPAIQPSAAPSPLSSSEMELRRQIAEKEAQLAAYQRTSAPPATPLVVQAAPPAPVTTGPGQPFGEIRGGEDLPPNKMSCVYKASTLKSRHVTVEGKNIVVYIRYNNGFQAEQSFPGGRYVPMDGVKEVAFMSQTDPIEIKVK